MRHVLYLYVLFVFMSKEEPALYVFLSKKNNAIQSNKTRLPSSHQNSVSV